MADRWSTFRKATWQTYPSFQGRDRLHREAPAGAVLMVSFSGLRFGRLDFKQEILVLVNLALRVMACTEMVRRDFHQWRGDMTALVGSHIATGAEFADYIMETIVKG